MVEIIESKGDFTFSMDKKVSKNNLEVNKIVMT